jgi:hypothetical protein
MLVRRIVLGGCAVLAFVALLPRQATIGTAYQVKVIDRTGLGVSQLTVHRNIEDFTGGEEANRSLDAVTDNQGEASFPAEVKRISLAGQMLGCVRQILSTGAHASCGTYSNIAVSSGQWIEVARKDTAASGRRRSLLLTLSECPSGDYWTCAIAMQGHN